MTKRENQLLLAAGLFLLGLCSGVVAAHFVLSDSGHRNIVFEPSSQASPEPKDSQELTLAIHELRNVLSSLDQSLAASRERPVVTVPAPRTDAAAPAPNLEVALQQIADALSALSSKSGSTPSASRASTLIAPGWVDRASAFAFLDVQTLADTRDDEVFNRIAADVTQRHLFWSLQDVLTRFGKPDDIQVDGNVIGWEYLKAKSVKGVGWADVCFYFSDGLLYASHVDFNDDES